MANSDDGISTIRHPAGLEQLVEFSKGGDHVTIAYNLINTGQAPIIEFSHDSATPRPDGWQRSFAAKLLANDNVRAELQRDGINPGYIMRLVNEQYRDAPVQPATAASRRAASRFAAVELA